MKKLFKWTFRVLFLLLVLVVALIVFRGPILKAVVEQRLRTETGMGVKIGRLDVGLTTPTITFEKLTLYNTAGFGGLKFLDVPELHVEYDPAALASRELRIRLLRFNLAELNVVKNEAGRTNVVELMGRMAARIKAREARQTKHEADLEFTGIDTLNLTLGRARFFDLGKPANNREINLGFKNQIVKNVKSEKDLYGVMLLVLLKHGAGFTGDGFTRTLLSDPAATLEKGIQQLREFITPPKNQTPTPPVKSSP